MAEADEKEKGGKEKKEESKAEKTGGGILQWIIMAVIIIVCAGAGLGLGRLFAGSGESTAKSDNESAQEQESAEAEQVQADDGETGSQKTWYYDLEPVVANLDEPGVTRYVRATLTLQISSELSEKKGIALFEEKKPVLTNWLTIYLASLGIKDIRGDRNLKRIQTQILDAFNEKLFPDSKPKIQHILFKEFAVQ